MSCVEGDDLLKKKNEMLLASDRCDIQSRSVMVQDEIIYFISSDVLLTESCLYLRNRESTESLVWRMKLDLGSIDSVENTIEYRRGSDMTKPCLMALVGFGVALWLCTWLADAGVVLWVQKTLYVISNLIKVAGVGCFVLLVKSLIMSHNDEQTRTLIVKLRSGQIITHQIPAEGCKQLCWSAWIAIGMWRHKHGERPRD